MIVNTNYGLKIEKEETDEISEFVNAVNQYLQDTKNIDSLSIEADGLIPGIDFSKLSSNGLRRIVLKGLDIDDDALKSLIQKSDISSIDFSSCKLNDASILNQIDNPYAFISIFDTEMTNTSLADFLHIIDTYFVDMKDISGSVMDELSEKCDVLRNMGLSEEEIKEYTDDFFSTYRDEPRIIDMVNDLEVSVPKYAFMSQFRDYDPKKISLYIDEGDERYKEHKDLYSEAINKFAEKGGNTELTYEQQMFFNNSIDLEDEKQLDPKKWTITLGDLARTYAEKIITLGIGRAILQNSDIARHDKTAHKPNEKGKIGFEK